MQIVHPGASLPELQSYMKEVCSERGWDKSSVTELFLLFSEEVGELAKAIRKRKRLFVETGKDQTDNIAEEFADVLSYLLDLANNLDIDIEKAFIEKEIKNQKREWK